MTRAERDHNSVASAAKQSDPPKTLEDGDSPFPGTFHPNYWRELGIVAGVLALIHTFLWSRALPLGHQDLSFYVEPAVLLAEQGWIAGPSSLNVDLTYTRGMYFYPPGYTLFLGAWISIFGYGAGSLVGYTNLLHLIFLLGLWALLRVRFRTTLLSAVLCMVSGFPLFNHGRPDLTALVLGVAAWLVLPVRPQLGRTALAALLLGLSVLVSPPFGLSSAGAVGIYYLLSLPGDWRARAKWFGILTALSIVVFAGSWALVLTWQDAWSFGIEQFTINSANRAAELNSFPPFSFYLLAFAAIPLGLLTLVPALAALLNGKLRRSRPVLVSVLAYLAGFITYFALSRAPLLTGAHFGLLGRPVMHGVLTSQKGWFGRLSILSVLGVAALNWYLQKDSWLALKQGFDGFDRSTAALVLPEVEVLGIDTDVFPHLYRPASSVNYETMQFDYWERYLEQTSPATLERLDLSTCTEPELPGAIVISSRTLMRFGLPDPAQYTAAPGQSADVPNARVLGRELSFPEDPEALYLFTRNPTAAGADSQPGCDLLPARR